MKRQLDARSLLRKEKYGPAHFEPFRVSAEASRFWLGWEGDLAGTIFASACSNASLLLSAPSLRAVSFYDKGRELIAELDGLRTAIVETIGPQESRKVACGDA